jgi:hypothetical protein
MVCAAGAAESAQGEAMSRWYDEQAEKHGQTVLDPFWCTRRGKLLLLAIFVTSIAAGAGIGLLLRLFGWS